MREGGVFIFKRKGLRGGSEGMDGDAGDAIVGSGQHVVLVGDLNISHKDMDVFEQWRVSDIYCPGEGSLTK